MNIVDFSALKSQISFRQVLPFITKYQGPGINLRAGIVPAIFVMGVMYITGAMTGPASPPWLNTVIDLAAIMIAAVSLVVFWFRRIIASVRQSLRYKDFAAANQLSYTMQENTWDTPTGEYQGRPFLSSKSESLLNDIFTTTNGPRVEFGNYSYAVGIDARYSASRHLGYICFDLTRSLPNIILDAKANNIGVFSELTFGIDRSQTLQLEGNFNDYFTLYVPQGYEQDALYVFTPDLMALLVDETQNYDAEIIGNKLYFYGKMFDFSNQAVWERIQAIVAVMEPKITRQTSMYVDERAVLAQDSVSGVTAEGQRLKSRRMVWIVVAIVVVYMVVIRLV